MNSPPRLAEIVLYSVLGRPVVPEGDITGLPSVSVGEALLGGVRVEVLEEIVALGLAEFENSLGKDPVDEETPEAGLGVFADHGMNALHFGIPPGFVDSSKPLDPLLDVPGQMLVGRGLARPLGIATGFRRDLHVEN